MKKLFFLALALLVALSGCTREPALEEDDDSLILGPGDMLDIDTDTVFSLGDSRDTFDNAFDYLGTEEKEGRYGTEVTYIDGVLVVTFKDNKAIEIECEGGTNRFEFCNFKFDMALEDIKGRSSLTSAAGYDFYTRYYDADSKDTDLTNSVFCHELMVRVGDLGSMKYGQYVHYSISLTGETVKSSFAGA